MFTVEGYPICDLCGMWTNPRTGYNFTVEKVRPVQRSDGQVVMFKKTVSLSFCYICHDVLHDRDTEALFYRQRVMLQIVGRMHMSSVQLAQLHRHCQSLIDDFDGGAYCSHDE